MTSSKMYFLNDNHPIITLDDINRYVEDFYNATSLIPTNIRVSNKVFFDFIRTFHNGHMVQSTDGKKPTQYILTLFGYLPIINSLDDKAHNGGYIVVEDSMFDKEFEDIVLKTPYRRGPHP